jgi:AAA+ superfamily predicted ATPase
MLSELVCREVSVTIRALAHALQESAGAISEALEPSSTLHAAGLITRLCPTDDLDDIVFPGALLQRLLLLTTTSDISRRQMDELIFASLCPPAPAPEFSIADFASVADLQLMLKYLGRAVAEGRRGRNILLYGPPGTGKSQLVYALADHLGAPLYEVPTQNREAGSVTGKARLESAFLAQRFLEDHTGSLLVFDEMEDAFRKESDLAKGWFNQLLERNPIPTLWVSNEIGQVDPAFLRRFDLIIEMKGARLGPNPAITEHLRHLPVTGPWVTSVQQKPWMTPALARNLADIGQFLPATQVVRNQQKLERLLEERLSALRHEPVSISVLPKIQETDFPTFKSEWLTTYPSLRNVERMLQGDKPGRLCLFGPPGAGKTAYASELADRLKRPFELVSGSDLQSCLVGETETNIAAMFQKAESSGAVLLLDEADTFLFSRETARQSWEVSATNEFMVRMERFSGVFLATTNRFDSLDSAVMRRFHLKVRFGYLDSRQLKNLLKACVLDPEKVEEVPAGTWAELDALTPGLVRTAVQQLRMMGLRPRTRPLLKALREEQSMQAGTFNRQPIGFV